MRVRFAHTWSSLCVTAIGLAHATASAQGTSQGALAEALFRSGRELMAKGNFAEACPKLAESERIDPKLGTLMNLALCHEKEGKTASAWAEYARAAELAHHAGQAERERVAKESARRLEGALSRVLIVPPAESPPGLLVKLDEQTIGQGAFGTPIPVDPGAHEARATAPGRKPHDESFTISAGERQREIHIPPLDPEANGALAAPPAARGATEGPSAGPRAPENAAPAGETNGRKTVGIVLLASGAALGGVGAFFGFRALSEKHTAEDECDATQCTQAGLDAIRAMKTSEAVATITIGAGVVAAGAGIYLLATGGKATGQRGAVLEPAVWRVQPTVGMRAGGLELQHSW
jgi:hypothetical protein